MIKSISAAALLSSLVISGVWAAPISPKPINEVSSSNLVHVGYYDKKYYKNKKYYKHHGYYNDKPRYYKGSRYYHGGRYWGHRYYARPSGWQTLGCVAVGPVWYCP